MEEKLKKLKKIEKQVEKIKISRKYWRKLRKWREIGQN